MSNKSEVTSIDGSVDWSSGVNSVKCPTIQSTENPNGLSSAELAWAQNCGMRDGGITPRGGYAYLARILATGLWQGGFMYVPDADTNPYLVFAVSGKIYSMGAGDTFPTLLSTTAALEHPAAIDYFHFCQGEQFLVIQAGDNVTLPLFYDGSTLRRSEGASRNLATTSANFTAPTISHAVNIPVNSWSGYDGENFAVNGDVVGGLYIKVNHNWFITLKNISNGLTGTVKAGTDLIRPDGSEGGRFLVSYAIPAFNATENGWLDRMYPGAVNDIVTIGGRQFQVTAITTTDAPPGDILAVNVNQTAGTVNSSPVSLTSIQEIGAAGPMDYYQGRLWYAIGRVFLAGDIVKGPSGTAIYNFRDSILKVTENPLCLAGDGFTVADNAGNIRTLTHNANINATLGQGNFFAGTRKVIYALSVPATRSDWTSSSDTKNTPTQTVIQIGNGPVNDRSNVGVNGDILFQNLEPNIASLYTTVRNFSQWGLVSLSANEQRILQFNDRNLLRFASGIYFNNRMLQTALPRQTARGVVHDALIPLDFVPLSSYGATLTPNWEGHHQGVAPLQMFTGDFGGRERAFAVVVSAVDQGIDLWEITATDKFDTQKGGEQVRIECYIETPAFTFGDINNMKELVSAELGIDRLFGTVNFRMDYRPDSDSCWHLWHEWKICSAKNTCEEGVNVYPCVPLGEGYRQNMTLPKPQSKCATESSRPTAQGYQFQCRLTWKGFCRIRSLRLYAMERETQLYQDIACP